MLTILSLHKTTATVKRTSMGKAAIVSQSEGKLPQVDEHTQSG